MLFILISCLHVTKCSHAL